MTECERLAELERLSRLVATKEAELILARRLLHDAEREARTEGGTWSS